MNSYQGKVKEKILDINFYLVKDIKQLDEIITVHYTTTNLHLLVEILKEGQYGKIASLTPVESLFGEYITCIVFQMRRKDCTMQ